MTQLPLFAPLAEVTLHRSGASGGPPAATWRRAGDAEALPLLLTLSSGVKGLTTIHAGSARQALTRLRFICQLADTSNELPLSALSALVSEAIDVVVHCTRIGGRVRVSEVLAVEELQTGRDGTQFTVTELFSRPRHDEPLAWTGNLPVRAGRFLEDAGYDVGALLDPLADGAAPPRPSDGARRASTTRRRVRSAPEGAAPA
jgi:pilus assembly protein CpaF